MKKKSLDDYSYILILTNYIMSDIQIILKKDDQQFTVCNNNNLFFGDIRDKDNIKYVEFTTDPSRDAIITFNLENSSLKFIRMCCSKKSYEQKIRVWYDSDFLNEQDTRTFYIESDKLVMV